MISFFGQARFFISAKALLFCLFFTIYISHANANEIKNIKFYQEGEISRINIEMDEGGTKANKFHVVEDKQIIVDLKDVTALPRVLRAFDTSEFSGTVVFVSPYKKPGSKKDIRLAIQLRDNARSIIESNGKSINLLIENRFGVFDKVKVEKGKKQELAVAQGENQSSLNIPKSDALEDILENLTLSGAKKYIGKKIYINVKDVPIVEVLNIIAETSGFNLWIDDAVKTKPNITLKLSNTPWDQCLDTVLGYSQLVAKRNGNILAITTLEKATEALRQELASQELAKTQEPLVTKIFRISYATLGEVQGILQQYLTPNRGTITVDNRTSQLIIKDTVESIDRIRKIIEILDTQTPQIMIESKIVEVQESHSKQLGLTNGISAGYDPFGNKGEGANPVNSDFPLGSDAINKSGPGFTLNSAPSSSDSLIAFQIGRFARLSNLNLTLQLMEQESKAKIIAAPRVITKNNQAATITSSETQFFTVLQVVDGATVPSVEPVEASLNLQVTPQVTNEGSISMQVNLSKTDFDSSGLANNQQPPTNTRAVNTNVLVDNGSTVVIGGVYRMSSSLSHSGVPFLKDIPLLGWLFRTNYNPSNSKTEMVIFLTPRIINQEEAGLVERTGEG